MNAAAKCEFERADSVCLTGDTESEPSFTGWTLMSGAGIGVLKNSVLEESRQQSSSLFISRGGHGISDTVSGLHNCMTAATIVG